MLQKLRILGFILLLASLTAQAQEKCSVQMDGFITEAETGKLLPGALVELRQDGKTVHSEIALSTGRWGFYELCPGSVYTLKVSYIGFQTAIREVRTGTGPEHIDISLLPAEHELDELEVEGKRRPALDESSRSQLTRQDIEAQSGKTLGESLERLPGVALLRTGPTIVKPMIHGLQGSRILILNQGVRHEGQQWGNDHAPEIDPMASGDLSVVKGAATVRYGADAMGGVVVAKPPALPDSVGFTGRANLTGATNNGLGAASGLLTYAPKWAPALAGQATGTYRRAGDARAPGYVLSNTGLEEWNAGYRLAYRRQRYGAELSYSRFATRLGILYSSHSGNATDLQDALRRNRPKEVYGFTYRIRNPYQKASHELVTAKGYYVLSERTRLELQVARQFNKRREFDRHKQYGVENYLDVPSVVFNLETRSAEASVSHFFTQHLELQAGLSYYDGRKTGNFDASTRRFLLRSLIPNYRSGLASAWAALEGERGYYRYGIGARADRKAYRLQEGAWSGQPSGRQFVNPGFSLNLARILGQHLTVEGALSYSGRTPSVAELYSRGLHHGLATVEVGNPRLNSERLASASTGVNLDFHDVTFTTNWYLNRFFGYINLIPSPPGALTVAGYFPVYRYESQDVLMMGSDWQAHWQITSGIYTTGTASLIRARDAKTGAFVQQIPSDRYRLEIGIKDDDFALSLNGQWVRKQWRLPGNLLSDSLDFAAPPKGYFLLGAAVSANLYIGRLRPIVSIEATNLLNTRYRDYLDRFRYFADAQGRNLMLRVAVPFGEKIKPKPNKQRCIIR